MRCTQSLPRWRSYSCFVSCFTLWCTPVAAQPDAMPTAAAFNQSCAGKILDTDRPCDHAKHHAADGRDPFVRRAGRLDRHGDQVRNGCDRRHGRNAEFHALTSCPAIPYAAGANVREAVLAIPPKCTYNRGIETR